MQSTADLHHEIADAVLPQPTPVFDDPTALDAAVDMFDPQPTLVQRLVGSVLLPCQFLAAGFLGRYESLFEKYQAASRLSIKRVIAT